MLTCKCDHFPLKTYMTLYYLQHNSLQTCDLRISVQLMKWYKITKLMRLDNCSCSLLITLTSGDFCGRFLFLLFFCTIWQQWGLQCGLQWSKNTNETSRKTFNLFLLFLNCGRLSYEEICWCTWQYIFTDKIISTDKVYQVTIQTLCLINFEWTACNQLTSVTALSFVVL